LTVTFSGTYQLYPKTLSCSQGTQRVYYLSSSNKKPHSIRPVAALIRDQWAVPNLFTVHHCKASCNIRHHRQLLPVLNDTAMINLQGRMITLQAIHQFKNIKPLLW